MYRLLTTKTYEMHMFHKASMKLGLDKAVLAHLEAENSWFEARMASQKEMVETLFAEMDGYTAESRAGEILLGAGIDQELHYGPMSEVAPGWKLRVLLAQALFGDPDILLLDEPTNNLDINSIRWLEGVLDRRTSTMVIISHDRHFLSAVCTHMADVDYGQIRVYAGNYDDARIKALDPKLNSIVEINPDALAIASELDRERKAGRVRGALHGIPVLIKDNIDTADKMKTTAGSLALLDAPTPQRDAFIVAQLRAAGAVILGKTNLSEWANYRSDSSSSGWSARGGQTRNPYVLDRTPCGSSSGSAAATAANLATVSIGTETNGSIICPSANTGLVGLKPTLGLVSRSGITQMGHQIAQQLGLCAIGRATNKHFLCYSSPQRLQLQPDLAVSRLLPQG